MTTEPLVSVIIPAFNAARWIERAVTSATSQTWQNVEVTVVDDGSTDDTAQIVETMNDLRVRLVRQENAGAAAARNLGLRNSRGDLVQFLDADDLLAPDKLALQIEALRQSPGGSVASCAWARFGTDPGSAVSVVEPVWTESEPIEWIIKSLSGGGMMQPACWLTPRAIAEQAGPWDETLSLHDDGEYFTRVLLESRMNVFVGATKVYYRDVPDSLSRRRGRDAIVSALAVCVSRHRHLLAARDSNAARRALATQYAQFAYEFGAAAPDLAAQALDAISRLGAQPLNEIGGGAFRTLAALLGFRTASALHALLSRRRA